MVLFKSYARLFNINIAFYIWEFLKQSKHLAQAFSYVFLYNLKYLQTH